MTSILSKQSLILTTFSLALTRLSYCSVTYSNIPSIANYFGTKGRYEEVNPYLLNNITLVNKSFLIPTSSEGCKPVHVTAIIRHGTRYPTVKNIKRMQRLYDLVINEASNDETWLEEIKSSWKMWYTDDMDGKLVEKGRDDHRYLAVRLSKLFPSLLSEANLRHHRIRFQTSSKHRCVDSIEAFQQGLHKHWGLEEVWYRHEVNDKLMRFFEHCRGFVEAVENNKTALAEVKKFKEGREMGDVRRKMAQQLNVPYERVTPDMVEAAFFLCAYEFAIKSLHTPWCHLFDLNDAKVLEYKNDLKQFWKRGHGHSINSRSSCVLFHDLFNRLELAVQHLRLGQELPEAVTVQVGHGETLLPLLSLLGLYKDPAPPTADNYSQQHGRSFRTSEIVPYAANMLFILYDCRDGPRVQFLLNETPVRFPGLTSETEVPLYSEVRQKYRELLEGCDAQKECEFGIRPQYRGHHGNTEL
ncbi:multiple inositol polyphosphate phosphatase 1b [Gadus macrocephalus]|uniref:multiple inositol polyphosphate phosphatase 1b n=1 Tax=Gadus macrocephalus TaxID=80720 RepID=UPI0028CB7803|nr:multiple inositol polyphosphate phosphatase 1b [Gadus macrocephalus]